MSSGGEKSNQVEQLTPLQQSLLPPKPSCLGCRTYFVQNQKLQLENISVEFKNYNQVPLVQLKHQFIILKTITAFLNTKGGAIYLGVEDQKCQIIGNIISKANQKEFKNFVANLCHEIYPQVGQDDVKTFFVPVLKRTGVFTGRYVTKIFVRQGKVDTFYTFAQKVNLISSKASESQRFQQRMGFIRIGPGGLQKISGLSMYEQVYRKSKDPHEAYLLHQGCNPEPMQVVSDIKLIGLKITKQRQNQYSNLLVKLIHSFGKADYSQMYDSNRNMMIIEFDSSVITQKIRDSIETQQMNITNENDRVKYLGIQNNTFMFGLSINQPNSKQKKAQKQEKVQQRKIKQQKYKQQSKKQSKQITATNTKQSNKQKQKQKTKKDCWGYYVYTHINVPTKDQFLEYLSVKLPKKFKFFGFINTIMIKLTCSGELDEIKNVMFKIHEELSKFGHSGKIIYGKLTGHIHIYNYFEKEKEKLKQAINSKLNNKIKKLTFKQDSNDTKRTYIDIQLQDKDCPQALDILLQADDLRAFKIFNKQSKGASVPKMKFMLQCD